MAKKKTTKKTTKTRTKKASVSKATTTKKTTSARTATKKTKVRKKTKSAAAAKPATKKKTTKTSRTKKAAASRTRPAKKTSAASKTNATAQTTNGEHAHTPDWTTEQLRKVKTGLRKKDLAFFQKELLERRAEIIGDLKGMESARSESAGDISHVPLHMADVGSDNYDREFTLSLMESERKLLLEIDEALHRIQEGTYGVCYETAKPIERPRLEYMPWAKYSLEVARAREKRGL